MRCCASARQLSRKGLVAVGLVSILASGCRHGRRTPADTVVVLLGDEVTELDPRYALTANDAKISRLVVAGLVAVDRPSLEPRLDLAERIEPRDATTWDVTVRDDARFSDGSPVTADDVAYTFRSIVDPAMKSFSRRAFEERLAGVDVIAPRVVRFRLRAPLATFMTDLDFGIVSKRAAEAEPGGRWPDGSCVGAGPFRVDRITPGEVVLLRNDHYHGGPPAERRVIVRTVRDANARLLLLVGGSADLTQNTVRLDLLADVERQSRLRVTTGPSAILTYLMFQNEDPILRDVRVRYAIAMAIDRERIVREKLGGHAVLATGLLAPGHWAYAGDVPRHAHDLAAARRLLDEAGYPEGPGGRPRMTLTYKTTADPFRLGVAHAIAQDLGEAGIAVEVRSFEFATFFADVKKGNFQLASMQTSEIVEPDMYQFFFHSSRVPTSEYPDAGNRWRYRSAAADQLIESGRRELDRPARVAIYARLQRLLADDLPILPLWHEDNVAVMSTDLVGYEVLPNARLSALARVTKRKR